jgi:hypothetical protein
VWVGEGAVTLNRGEQDGDEKGEEECSDVESCLDSRPRVAISSTNEGREVIAEKRGVSKKEESKKWLKRGGRLKYPEVAEGRTVKRQGCPGTMVYKAAVRRDRLSKGWNGSQHTISVDGHPDISPGRQGNCG